MAESARDGEAAERQRKVSFGTAHKFTYESRDRLKELERGFVLDSVCLSHLANDETNRTFPSLNIGIPQYKAKSDWNCRSYFKRRGLPKPVREDSHNQGEEKQSSMQGRVVDRFCASSQAMAYLNDKKKEGAGKTRQQWGGHTSIPTDPAVVGWNSEDGYRRNTFELRARRSVFDYEDPYESPKQLRNTRQRTQSAPVTMQQMRLKSASTYRSFPGRRRQTMSAVPHQQSCHMTRSLATGPVT